MAHNWVISPFTLSVLKRVANFRFGGHFVGHFGIPMKIEYLFNPQIFSALYIFYHWSISISYRTFTVWGVNYPPSKPGNVENTVAGLRVNVQIVMNESDTLIVCLNCSMQLVRFGALFDKENRLLEVGFYDKFCLYQDRLMGMNPPSLGSATEYAYGA